MQLALWIALCLAAALVLRRHARVLIVLVIGLWILVPAVGASVVTGVDAGPLGFHPATWLVLCILAVRILYDPWSILQALARRFLLFLVLAVVIIVALLASLSASTAGGLVVLVDQILVPVLFFLLLLSEASRAGGLVATLRGALLLFVAVACFVAVLQWRAKDVLIFESGYSTQYWFERQSGRWMGTLDQPLALSLAISVAAPLVAGLRYKFLQAALLVLMVVGSLLTQSRVGIIAVALSVVAAILFGPGRVWVKSFMLAGLAAAGAAIVSSPLVDGVTARLADDSGSAQAREAAVGYFLARWDDYVLGGGGIGSSFRLAFHAGLASSLENPLLMYSVDIGIVAAVLYFGSMLVLVARSGFRLGYSGLALAGVLALVIPQTYSSLATRSAAGILVWTVLAMVVIAGDERRERNRQEHAAAALAPSLPAPVTPARPLPAPVTPARPLPAGTGPVPARTAPAG